MTCPRPRRRTRLALLSVDADSETPLESCLRVRRSMMSRRRPRRASLRARREPRSLAAKYSRSHGGHKEKAVAAFRKRAVHCPLWWGQAAPRQPRARFRTESARAEAHAAVLGDWSARPTRPPSRSCRPPDLQGIQARARQDSNLRPLAPEASALSTELRARVAPVFRCVAMGA
jgi:hypothetical protein